MTTPEKEVEKGISQETIQGIPKDTEHVTASPDESQHLDGDHASTEDPNDQKSPEGSGNDVNATIDTEKDSEAENDNVSHESNEESEKCTPNCKFKTEDPTCDSIQCCLCMFWFHIDCVSITPKELKKIDFWPCPDCRLLCRNVRSLQKSMNELIEIFRNAANASILGDLPHKDSHECGGHCEMLLTETTKECEKLQSENKRLTQIIHDKVDLSSEDDETEDESDCQIMDENTNTRDKHLTPVGHLVIGDSLIRDIEPYTDDVRVACKRGAKFQDVIKWLKNNKQYYESITIVCGTNNVSSKISSDKILENAEKRVCLAKTKSKNVTLSSIPPRLDKAVTDQRLCNTNECLRITAEANDVHFIDHDKNFRFMNEIPDMTLLLDDGLHLSTAGVQRLIMNLKVKDFVRCKNDQVECVNSKNVNESSKDRQKKKTNTKSRNGVTVFFGKDSIFSNLHMTTPIIIDGQKFSCNEQYYTHKLATFFGDEMTSKRALETEDPYKLVELHKKVQNYDLNRWLPEAEKVLFFANLAKYTQNSSARAALLNTHEDQIGEASYSRTWGIGIPIQDKYAMDCNSWKGKNIMGKLLMKIRDTLRNKDQTERNRNIKDRQYITHRHYDNQAYKNKTCWYCGEENHISKNCKHGYKLQCNTCYEYGHKAKFCYSC